MTELLAIAPLWRILLMKDWYSLSKLLRPGSCPPWPPFLTKSTQSQKKKEWFAPMLVRGIPAAASLCESLSRKVFPEGRLDVRRSKMDFFVMPGWIERTGYRSEATAQLRLTGSNCDWMKTGQRKTRKNAHTVLTAWPTMIERRNDSSV